MTDDSGRQRQIEDKLHTLHDAFRAKLPHKLSDIGAAWQDCTRQPADRERWMTLHRLLHTLAGSAGSFGFADLGMQARHIEKELNALLAAGETRRDSAMTILDERMRQLLNG